MKKAFHSIFAMILAGVAVTGCTDEVQFGDSFLNKAPGGSTKRTVSSPIRITSTNF